MDGRSVRVVARAKVNLWLRVLGLREDGFHELETVMQTVGLADEVVVERTSAGGGVAVEWAPGLSGPLPGRPDIVERALGLVGEGLCARVVKRIPIGAGLGGGSADAAAALMGGNVLLGSRLEGRLLGALALRLGSDVPFALAGGTALARGRGEVLTPAECGEMWWVLGIPSVRLSTAAVYRRHDEMGAAPSAVRAGAMVAALAGEAGEVAAHLHNDLEVAAFDLEPSLQALKEAMLAAGALGAVMTGSGSAIAGLCRDRGHAERVAAGAAAHFGRVEVAASAGGAEIA